MSPRPLELPDHLTHAARAWHAEGEPEVHDGHTIHVRRRVGGAPLLLLLHGFGTSSFDWHYVLSQEREHAAITFDFLGFGCSEKPRGHDYELVSQADLAEQLVIEHGEGRRVLAVAHDMGTSVAAELIARDVESGLGFELAGALLVNGGLAVDEGGRARARKLVHGPLGGRFGGERHFRHELAELFSSEHKLDKELASDQSSLFAHNDGQKVGDELLAYLDDEQVHLERWRSGFRHWDRPVAVLWGKRDPLASEAALAELRDLRSGIEVTELPDVGHYPHLEVPSQVDTAIRQSIAKVNEQARQARRAD